VEKVPNQRGFARNSQIRGSRETQPVKTWGAYAACSLRRSRPNEIETVISRTPETQLVLVRAGIPEGHLLMTRRTGK